MLVIGFFATHSTTRRSRKAEIIQFNELLFHPPHFFQEPPCTSMYYPCRVQIYRIKTYALRVNLAVTSTRRGILTWGESDIDSSITIYSIMPWCCVFGCSEVGCEMLYSSDKFDYTTARVCSQHFEERL